MKRAGILDRPPHVAWRSDDLVGRSPIQPPWAIYPLSPTLCASLIVDMAFYAVTVSGPSLLDALGSVGLTGEWVLPTGQPELQPGQVILRAYKGARGIEMRPSDMQRLLLELVDLSTWAESVRGLLDHGDLSGHPWPHYSDEWRVWA